MERKDGGRKDDGREVDSTNNKEKRRAKGVSSPFLLLLPSRHALSFPQFHTLDSKTTQDGESTHRDTAGHNFYTVREWMRWSREERRR